MAFDFFIPAPENQGQAFGKMVFLEGLRATGKPQSFP